MFAAAAKENAREPLAGSERHQHRRLNCFNDFVGSAGCMSAAGADDNEVVFFGGGFAENLRSRLPLLDCSFELDTGSSEDVGFLSESLSEWLFVARIFRDAEERDLGFGRAGQSTAEPCGVVRGRSAVGATQEVDRLW